VYSTLNELTQSNNFPQLENQSILLNPNNFYDAHLRTTQPILNADIGINRNIRQNQAAVQELELGIYKRALVKDIKTAYFQYLKSLEAAAIYGSALDLTEESLRINQSLLKNDKATRTAVVRSEGEVAKYQAQLESARLTTNSARAYFNFLLNRPPDAEILADEAFAQLPPAQPMDSTTNRREELRQLAHLANITQELTALAKAQERPKLSTFLDLGAQGFDFKVDKGTPYFLFGVALEWNLFTAKRNDLKVQQAQVESSIVQSRTQFVENQLQLQLITALNDFQTALSQHRAAVVQVGSADKYHRDVLRLYKEGQALHIELLDAQNEVVTSHLQANISRYDVWVKLVGVEDATASAALK
jgi:outer membrane protein TolC